MESVAAYKLLIVNRRGYGRGVIIEDFGLGFQSRFFGRWEGVGYID